MEISVATNGAAAASSSAEDDVTTTTFPEDIFSCFRRAGRVVGGGGAGEEESRPVVEEEDCNKEQRPRSDAEEQATSNDVHDDNDAFDEMVSGLLRKVYEQQPLPPPPPMSTTTKKGSCNNSSSIEANRLRRASTGTVAAASAGGTTTFTGAGSTTQQQQYSSSPHQQQVIRIVSSGLSAIHLRYRQIMDRVEEEKVRQEAAHRRAVRTAEEELVKARQASAVHVEEVKEQYEDEIRRLCRENESAIVAASEAAADATERCRTQLVVLKAEAAKMRQGREDEVAAAAAEAAERATKDADGRFQDELRQMTQQHAGEMAVLRRKYDEVEAELLEAIDEVENLEEAIDRIQDEEIPALEKEIENLRKQLTDSKSEYNALQKTASETVKGLESERDALKSKLAESHSTLQQIQASSAARDSSVLHSRVADLEQQLAEAQAKIIHLEKTRDDAILDVLLEVEGSKPKKRSSAVAPPAGPGRISVDVGRAAGVSNSFQKSPTSAFAEYGARSNNKGGLDEYITPGYGMTTPATTKYIAVRTQDPKTTTSKQANALKQRSKIMAPASSTSKVPAAARGQSRIGKPMGDLHPNHVQTKRQASASASASKAQGGRVSKKVAFAPSTASSSLKAPSTSSKAVIGGGVAKQRSLLTKYQSSNLPRKSNLPVAGGKATKELSLQRRQTTFSTNNAHGCTSQSKISTLSVSTTDHQGLSKDHTTSPKEIIRNVLESMSPENNHQASTLTDSPKNIPYESIELSPKEATVDTMRTNFEHLITGWSERKQPATDNSRTPRSGVKTSKPLAFVSSSTAKKTRRHEDTDDISFNSKRIKKGTPPVTPARRITVAYTNAGQDSVQSKLGSVFLESLLSPEASLLSPVQAGLGKVNEEPINKKRSSAEVAVIAKAKALLAQTDHSNKLAAAVKLQAQARTMICRRTFLTWSNKAVVLQCLARYFLARKRADQKRTVARQLLVEKRKFAATSIQKVCRGHRQRVEYAQSNESLLRLQGFARISLARRQLQTLKKRAFSATLIQKLCRGRQQRVRYAQLKESIVRLQCLGRWYLANKLVEQKRIVALQLASEKRLFAATVLQSFFRNSLARSQLQNLRAARRESSAVVIEAAARMMMARARFNRQRKSATSIQAKFRKLLDRRRFLKYKTSAIAIQTNIRGFLLRKKQQQHASIYIQRLVRSFLARKVLQQLKTEKDAAILCCRQRSAVVLQSAARGLLDRRQFLTCKASAIKIQSSVRSFLARKDKAERDAAILVRQQNAAVVIQSAARCKKAQSRYNKLKDSAIQIQTYARASLARSRLQALKDAARDEIRRRQQEKSSAITIQSRVRGALARRLSIRKRVAARTIQRCVRVHIHRRRNEHKRCASVCIQRFARSFLARKTLKVYAVRRQYASIIIQSLYRCKKARQIVLSKRDEKNRQELASTTIQSLVRSFLARSQARRLRERVQLEQARLRSDSVVVVQRIWRGSAQQRRYLSVREGILLFQALFRGNCSRTQFYASVASILCLQRYCRGRQERKRYLSFRNNVTRAQAVARGHITRVQYRKVKESAQAAARQQRSRPRRKPLGDVEPSTTKRSAPALASPSPVKRQRSRPEAQTENSDENGLNARRRPDETEVESLKVLQLRQVLLDSGLEKKEYSKLKKAELIQKVLEKGTVEAVRAQFEAPPAAPTPSTVGVRRTRRTRS